MNIAVICSRLDMAGGGGMERLARDVLEGLVDRGVQPLVLTRTAEARLPLVGRLERVRRIGVGLVPGKLRDRYFSWRADRIARGEGVDAVVSFHRTHNADVVICGGNHLGFIQATGRKPGLADRLHIAMERRQYAVAKTIIANSGLMRDELIEYYGVDPKRIVVLYPTVDTSRFKPASPAERAELRRSFGFAPDRKIFVFPSGDHTRKGLPFIRPFFESTDLPVELVVAGREVQPGRNVRGLGFVRNIEQVFQAADATILASGYEPFGMVGVESVCCGTPAVFADNMACCEAVAEPGMLRFSLADPDSLPRAIERAMVFDRAACPDLSSCIRYDVRKEFFVDQLLKIL